MAAFQRRGLLAGPGADLGEARAGGEIGVGLRILDPLDRPAQPHLPVERLPMEQQGALLGWRPIPAPFGCRCWCRRRIPARRSPSSAPCGRWASRRRRRWRATSRSGRAARFAVASSNQAANSRKGSSASVKSPLVNQVGCFIGADSDILRSIQVVALVPRSLPGSPVIEERHADGTVRRCRPRCRCWRWRSASGGCSFSYQLDNMFSKKDDAEHTASLRLAAAQGGRRAAGRRRPRLRPRRR